MSEEEEKQLSRLEKRLVANVDFYDQAFNSLGFGTNIYYMFGQADKSPIVVKGPFFPRVVNPRYRIRGTNM
jgi:hypothetical protein